MTQSLVDPRFYYDEGEVNIHYRTPTRSERKEDIPEEELRKRQEEQMRDFYDTIERKKEAQRRIDAQSRKHHDTLLYVAYVSPPRSCHLLFQH